MFDPQHPCESWVHGCMSVTSTVLEWRNGKISRAQCQATWTNQWATNPIKGFVSKSKMERDCRTHPMPIYGLHVHVHRHLHTCVHTLTLKHIHKHMSHTCKNGSWMNTKLLYFEATLKNLVLMILNLPIFYPKHK